MALPRASSSSYQSRDSTAVDPQSAFSSPNLAQGHIGQRPCTEHGDSEFQDPSVSSGSSMSSKRNEYRERYGWPRLAEIMADIPEFAAFPRYRDLNLRNLLYYKAQIDNLKMKILRQEEEQKLNLERFDLIANEQNATEHISVKNYRQMLTDLRVLLSGYNEALLQYSNVSALSDPEAHNMRSLREWLATEDSTCVRGPAGQDKTWDDVSQSAEPKWGRARTVLNALLLAKQPPKSNLDLVITHPEAKIDGLTKWVVYWLMPFYWERRDRYRLAKDAKSSTVEMKSMPDTQVDAEAQLDAPIQKPPQRDPKTLESASESTALRITSALSTVMACLIPVVAIAALTQLHGTRDLLICITGFAVLFAAGLIFLTQGTSSRTEIFAATAAFSAVMVVFISQPIIQVAPGSSVSVEA